MKRVSYMIENHLKDYYSLKISLKEICEKEGINQSTFYRYLKENNLLSRRGYYGLIALDDDELNTKIKDKYAGIVKRCNGRHDSGNYNGKEYMAVYDWVFFCNENKQLLKEMWDNFLKQNRSNKYRISIDRIDNEKGYTRDNVEFVEQGYNSWKRNIRPVEVESEGKHYYFMSCEEASKSFNLKRHYMGQLLNCKIIDKNYNVENSSIAKVLEENGFKDVKEYYKGCE